VESWWLALGKGTDLSAPFDISEWFGFSRWGYAFCFRSNVTTAGAEARRKKMRSAGTAERAAEKSNLTGKKFTATAKAGKKLNAFAARINPFFRNL